MDGIMEGIKEFGKEPLKIKELEEEIKSLKKENAEMKSTLNKLKTYVHPRYHYLYFKEETE
tara:strand:- start:729 stop:911 length:183 start_codon:yes stop_codon:yes gene_type:complete